MLILAAPSGDRMEAKLISFQHALENLDHPVALLKGHGGLGKEFSRPHAIERVGVAKIAQLMHENVAGQQHPHGPMTQQAGEIGLVVEECVAEV